MLKKIFRFLGKLIYKFLALIIILFFVIYALAPIYEFPEYKPFSGDKIFNPYENIDSTQWKKGNFQVQSRVWWGLTNGRNNTNEAVQAIYKQLGYDIIVTSDYMKINKFGKDKNTYIPTYEHGYGIQKHHQVCIGSEKVCWLDYPFYQNLSHKQNILNHLREKNRIVAIAHPRIRNAYSLEDMQYLTNYDLIEALNQLCFSLDHWDAALSSGHVVYLLADDDAHDVFNPNEVGRVCTFINTASLKKQDVIDALKSGKAFGADIFMPNGADFVRKAEDHKKIPCLNYITVKNDTLFVGLSETAKSICFIGQNGVVKKTSTDTTGAFYRIMPINTYIRTEITFPNTTKFYLNPVFRYSGDYPAQQAMPVINHVKTWIQRGIAFFIVIIFSWIFLFVRKKKKRKARITKRYYER